MIGNNVQEYICKQPHNRFHKLYNVKNMNATLPIGVASCILYGITFELTVFNLIRTIVFSNTINSLKKRFWNTGENSFQARFEQRFGEHQRNITGANDTLTKINAEVDKELTAVGDATATQTLWL